MLFVTASKGVSPTGREGHTRTCRSDFFFLHFAGIRSLHTFIATSGTLIWRWARAKRLWDIFDLDSDSRNQGRDKNRFSIQWLMSSVHVVECRWNENEWEKWFPMQDFCFQPYMAVVEMKIQCWGLSTTWVECTPEWECFQMQWKCEFTTFGIFVHKCSFMRKRTWPLVHAQLINLAPSSLHDLQCDGHMPSIVWDGLLTRRNCLLEQKFSFVGMIRLPGNLNLQKGWQIKSEPLWHHQWHHIPCLKNFWSDWELIYHLHTPSVISLCLFDKKSFFMIWEILQTCVFKCQFWYDAVRFHGAARREQSSAIIQSSVKTCHENQ